MVGFNKHTSDKGLWIYHRVRVNMSSTFQDANLYTNLSTTNRLRWPAMGLLEDAIDESKRIYADKYKEGIRILRDAARTEGIDKTLAAHDLDVILGPMDGRIPTIAAAAGYPVGTMPLGYSKTNDRPFGMCIVAAACQEEKILRAMRAWDATIGKRKAPSASSNAEQATCARCISAQQATVSLR